MAPTTTASDRNGGADGSSGSGAAACDPLLVDARKVTIELVQINEHFVCSLCHGYLRDAQAIKECLHTFCNGCIRPHFMSDKRNNSCPTCRVELGVRPWEQLMPDPAIQELTVKILPDFREQDRILAEDFYAQLGIPRKAVAKPAVEQPAPVRNKHVCGPSPNQLVSFEVRAQRSRDAPLFLWLKPLKKSQMRTQALLKIMHLRKYIAKKLRSVRPEEVEVLCRGTPVGPEYSLEFIRRTIWKSASSKMVLEFRRQLV
ncbi:hypothetical protein PybrP1_006665 [[Pythium] brassicae (nom. inval.)]|nr:hypothetical protein PybrP1_006665 [[Pythium] brassicae (nom. inval.)]